jgi:hypothetical protein
MSTGGCVWPEVVEQRGATCLVVAMVKYGVFGRGGAAEGSLLVLCFFGAVAGVWLLTYI